MPIWSVYFHIKEPGWIIATHVAFLTAMFLFTIGFATRLTAVLTWVGVLSYIHRLPVFMYAWYADVPDPDNFLFKLFHSQSSRNFTGYANQRVDGLLARARTEPDTTRRVELYRRAEQAILEDAPILPMWHYSYERIFQPYVRSVEVSGLGDPYIPLRKVWLAK